MDFTPSFQNAQHQSSILITDSKSHRAIYQMPEDSSQETNINNLVSSGGSLGSDNSLEENLKSSYKYGRHKLVVNLDTDPSASSSGTASAHEHVPESQFQRRSSTQEYVLHAQYEPPPYYL